MCAHHVLDGSDRDVVEGCGGPHVVALIADGVAGNVEHVAESFDECGFVVLEVDVDHVMASFELLCYCDVGDPGLAVAAVAVDAVHTAGVEQAAAVLTAEHGGCDPDDFSSERRSEVNGEP